MRKALLVLSAHLCLLGTACSGGDAGTTPVTTPQVHLAIAGFGDGAGSVISQPLGISCTVSGGTTSPDGCGADIDEGTAGSLSATPGSGSAFSGWSGGGCSGSGACVITMDQARTITAAFTRVGFSLSVNGSGTGSGTVTSVPVGLACTVTAGLASAGPCIGLMDGQVGLTATPASGSAFAGWSGACSGTGDCLVTMTQATVVTASFSYVGYTLSVFGGGIGDGTVTSGPAGIDCTVTAGVGGAGGCTANFDQGVQLVAAPTPSSVFAGWGGDCSGTGTCVLTMTQARNVTAAFAPGTAPTITLQSGISGSAGPCPLPPVGYGSGTPVNHRYTFGYVDVEGDVSAGAFMTDFITYHPSGDTLTVPLPNITITGNGYSGTVTMEMCLRDDPSPTVTNSITLTDLGGHTSAPKTFTTY